MPAFYRIIPVKNRGPAGEDMYGNEKKYAYKLLERPPALPMGPSCRRLLNGQDYFRY